MDSPPSYIEAISAYFKCRFVDFAPICIKGKDLFSPPKYEPFSYDKALNDFHNIILNKNPTPGKILNIEVVAINKSTNDVEDADGSLLAEDAKPNGFVSTIFRLFYLNGPRLYEKIALKSNITDRIDYTLSKHSLGYFFNVIRVFYVTGQDSRVDYPINVSCRVFLPAVLVTKLLNRHVFETYDELYSREILPFITYNSHAKVINYEIVPAYPQDDPQIMSHTRIDKGAVLIVASVRVYFNENIREPPIGVIQPKPIPIREDAGRYSMS
ncbi:DgyrCDS9051 [Dimorphilus gyrociliatus]|uniref:DgyrCDS9051 n=1 Tax=Dimorphilus gyrociliatus TaxID=2664684 RepID=A0A7I8VYA3_9ANNE|nr:DgyrCDS9051 [Dimorphilus gyrociliatus]